MLNKAPWEHNQFLVADSLPIDVLQVNSDPRNINTNRIQKASGCFVYICMDFQSRHRSSSLFLSPHVASDCTDCIFLHQVLTLSDVYFQVKLGTRQGCDALIRSNDETYSGICLPVAGGDDNWECIGSCILSGTLFTKVHLMHMAGSDKHCTWGEILLSRLQEALPLWYSICCCTCVVGLQGHDSRGVG